MTVNGKVRAVKFHLCLVVVQFLLLLGRSELGETVYNFSLYPYTYSEHILLSLQDNRHP